MQLSMRFGGKILFKNSSFQLNPGSHYGLVGANGSGKSTLIKILAGEISSEAGQVETSNQTSIGTLKQNQFLYENVSIINTVLMGNQLLWNALEEKHQLLEKKPFGEQECQLLEKLEKVIDAQGGYSAEAEASKLLEGLGIETAHHHKPMHTLSGGYKLRVLLAQVLFSRPGLLLLDEPTNHLDLFSIKWLEDYLKSFPGTLLISSHDRDFLNGICDHILDLDHEAIRTYKGNYDAFLEQKAFIREQAEAQLKKQEKKRDDIQEFIDRFKSKASKARQAQSKMRFVEKLEESMDGLDLSNSSRMNPILQFEICRPSSAIVLKVDQLHKSYGEKNVLKNVSFEVERGDRIAVLGPNGIGKSTLLEILTSHAVPDQGKFEWGFAAQHAYFPQDHKRDVHGKITLLEWLGQYDRLMPEEKLREVLARVLFKGDDVKKHVDILSGGETARLILAKMMLVKHNVLIFDEPTNHLDMEAMEALTESLDNYEGTLIFVSHNRRFVSRTATRFIEVTREGVKDFRCTYSDYIAQREIDLLSSRLSLRKGDRQQVESSSESDQKRHYEQQKNSRKIKTQLERKMKQAEEQCHSLENEIERISEQLAAEGFYTSTPPAKQQAVLAKKEALEKELENAFNLWEEAAQALQNTS